MCLAKRPRRSSGPGQDQGPGLVDDLGPLGRGLCAWRPSAPGSPRPSRRGPSARRGGPAGLCRPGSADGIERVRLPRPAPVLTIRTVHLHHPHTSRSDVTGQASAIAAGPFDPHQADGPEDPPASPAAGHMQPRQPGTPGKPSSPPGRIKRGGDVHVGVSAHPAGDGACLLRWSTSSLSVVEGWHAPAGRRSLRTPASCPGQADRDRHRRWVHKNLGPADSSFLKTARAASADSEVRPGPRPPTLRPRQAKAREAGPEALPTPSLPIRRWAVS